jgi:hypothetical protein
MCVSVGWLGKEQRLIPALSISMMMMINRMTEKKRIYFGESVSQSVRQSVIQSVSLNDRGSGTFNLLA